jgi:hypothetical protein
MAFCGFSWIAGVDSKSRQSALRNARMVPGFVFLCARVKKSLKNLV